jgi:hypothetical protein
MTEFWRARQSYEHSPQSFEQAPKGTVITLGENRRRVRALRMASLHRAIGQDAEDAAPADAERAAENTSRASGPPRAGRSELQ